MDYINRRATSEDYNRICEIWLSASKIAHSFIPGCFWEERERDLKELYLPNSQVWICTAPTGTILGFLASRDAKIEALFVSPEEQAKGIGKFLLNEIKKIREVLTLFVYEKNFHAKAFYESQGFRVIHRRIDEDTKEWELLMEWKSK